MQGMRPKVKHTICYCTFKMPLSPSTRYFTLGPTMIGKYRGKAKIGGLRPFEMSVCENIT